MHHAAAVRHGQHVGDGGGYPDRLAPRQCAAGQPAGKYGPASSSITTYGNDGAIASGASP